LEDFRLRLKADPDGDSVNAALIAGPYAAEDKTPLEKLSDSEKDEIQRLDKQLVAHRMECYNLLLAARRSQSATADISDLPIQKLFIFRHVPLFTIPEAERIPAYLDAVTTFKAELDAGRIPHTQRDQQHAHFFDVVATLGESLTSQGREALGRSLMTIKTTPFRVLGEQLLPGEPVAKARRVLDMTLLEAKPEELGTDLPRVYNGMVRTSWSQLEKAKQRDAYVDHLLDRMAAEKKQGQILFWREQVMQLLLATDQPATAAKETLEKRQQHVAALLAGSPPLPGAEAFLKQYREYVARVVAPPPHNPWEDYEWMPIPLARPLPEGTRLRGMAVDSSVEARRQNRTFVFFFHRVNADGSSDESPGLDVMALGAEGGRLQPLGFIDGRLTLVRCVEGRVFAYDERRLMELKDGHVRIFKLDEKRTVERIMAMDYLDGSLYLSYSGSLVRLHLGDSRLEVLADWSGNESKENELDKRGPYILSFVHADPIHKRLWISANSPLGEGEKGVWTFTPATEKFERVLDRQIFASTPTPNALVVQALTANRVAVVYEQIAWDSRASRQLYAVDRHHLINRSEVQFDGMENFFFHRGNIFRTFDEVDRKKQPKLIVSDENGIRWPTPELPFESINGYYGDGMVCVGEPIFKGLLWHLRPKVTGSPGK
jgi:hypothetical protein